LSNGAAEDKRPGAPCLARFARWGGCRRGMIRALCLLLTLGMVVPLHVAHAELAGHGGFVKGVAVSADGRQAATASFDYSAKLWDIGSQRELRSFDAHGGGVNAVAFVPGAREILTGACSGVAPQFHYL